MWKNKKFIIFSGIMAMLVLALAIRIAWPCRTYRLEGSLTFEPGTAENVSVYKDIALSPGVYLVRLEYTADTDLNTFCNVWDGEVFQGGLLSNGEHFYQALGITGFAMWLYESTDSLQVVVNYNGVGDLSTGNLTIVETKQLWTMLLAVLLFLWACAVCGMTFCHYDRMHLIPAEKKNVLFWLMAISLMASVPYLCGYTITGADLTYHLQRIEGVKDGLLGGQFPVRLEPRWLYDHGYANGIFYCNFFLYFPAILRLLGFPISFSYNVYCIVLNIATVWISYGCFYKMFRRREVGVLCSALYTLSIFRIYKLVITSATGEGTAFTFLPLILYGLYCAFEEEEGSGRQKRAYIPLMLGLTGVVLSHMLTCEITALVVLAFCLFYIRKIFHKDVFRALFQGAFFALMLCLWFLVPFLDYYLTQDVHIKHVSARTIQESGLYLAHLAFHFWRTGSSTPSGTGGMQSSHPVGLGLVLLIGLAVFCLLWFGGSFRKEKAKELAVPGLPFFKVTAVVGSMLLFMSLKAFPWDKIQSLHPVLASLVSSLQFPNRFLGWGTACLTALFACCLVYFQEKKRAMYQIMALAAAIGVVTSGLYLLDHVNRTQDYFELYNEEGMGFGYISGAEYLIQGTEEEELTYAAPVPGAGVEILQYQKKPLGAEMSVTNGMGLESYVQVPLLSYKGYRAVDQDSGRLLPVYDGENHKLCVEIPANFTGNIKVRFVSPFYWRMAELLSAGTFAALMIAGWKNRRRKGC